MRVLLVGLACLFCGCAGYSVRKENVPMSLRQPLPVPQELTDEERERVALAMAQENSRREAELAGIQRDNPHAACVLRARQAYQDCLNPWGVLALHPRFSSEPNIAMCRSNFEVDSATCAALHARAGQ